MDEPQKPAEETTQQPMPQAVAEPAKTPEQPESATPPQSEEQYPVATASTAQPVVVNDNKKILARLFYILAAVFLLAAVGIGVWYMTQNIEEGNPEASAYQKDTSIRTFE